MQGRRGAGSSRLLIQDLLETRQGLVKRQQALLLQQQEVFKQLQQPWQQLRSLQEDEQQTAKLRQRRVQVMQSCQQMLQQQEGLLKLQTRLEGQVLALEEQVLSSSAAHAAVAQQEATAEAMLADGMEMCHNGPAQQLAPVLAALRHSKGQPPQASAGPQSERERSSGQPQPQLQLQSQTSHQAQPEQAQQRQEPPSADRHFKQQQIRTGRITPQPVLRPPRQASSVLGSAEQQPQTMATVTGAYHQATPAPASPVHQAGKVLSPRPPSCSMLLPRAVQHKCCLYTLSVHGYTIMIFVLVPSLTS